MFRRNRLRGFFDAKSAATLTFSPHTCYNLFMNKNAQRAIAYFANFVLLFSGVIAALISAACDYTPKPFFFDSTDVLLIIVLCFLAVFVLVEIVSVFKISDSTFHTVLTSLALFCYIFFSDDFVNLLRNTDAPTYLAQLFDSIQFGFFELLTLSLVYFWNYTYALSLKKRHAICLMVGAALCFAAYVGLYFVDLQLVGYFAYWIELCAVLLVQYREVYRNGKTDFSFFVTDTLLQAVLGLSLVETLCNARLIHSSAVGYASFYGLVCIVIFFLIYVAFAMRTDREALKASKYKLQYETVKSEALRAQIKPHFVFNSLAVIQSLYHKSLADGDKATNLFSKHLRANVEAVNTDLIPFERELDNIQVYIDLENMRQEHPFNVIFDVDYTDFEIPVLSLQPYIENAIRYSRINEKPDGYIKISSVRTDEDILLEISDNGVGFDTASISDKSCGIRNSHERFSMLMGVEPQIYSKQGEGTVVTLHIPFAKESQ